MNFEKQKIKQEIKTLKKQYKAIKNPTEKQKELFSNLLKTMENNYRAIAC